MSKVLGGAAEQVEEGDQDLVAPLDRPPEMVGRHVRGAQRQKFLPVS
jgi:hypothetical protein